LPPRRRFRFDAISLLIDAAFAATSPAALSWHADAFADDASIIDFLSMPPLFRFIARRCFRQRHIIFFISFIFMLMLIISVMIRFR